MHRGLLFFLLFPIIVFSQILTISEGSNNPAAAKESGAAGHLVLFPLHLQAGLTEDLVVKSIAITQTGSGLIRYEIDNPEIRIYRDKNSNSILDKSIDKLITIGNNASSTRGVPSKNTLVLPDWLISNNSTQDRIIVHSISGGDVGVVPKTFSVGDGQVTFNTSGEVINAGQSEYRPIVCDLDGSATDGETFRVGTYNTSEVSAQGVTSSQLAGWI